MTPEQINEQEANLDICDLPEPLKSYADIIGIEPLCSLADKQGGRSIYIPTKECLVKYSFKKRIRKEFNGNNLAELQEKYNLSRTTIYRYLKDEN